MNNIDYKASLTREQFLFYEMRTTAQLITQDLQKDEIIRQIVSENLFQYPTEKSVSRMAKLCIDRLAAMEDSLLIEAVANQPVDTSKQICLYAMMKQSRLVCEFMITVVAEKYRIQDFTLSKSDMNIFFMRLQEQDDVVATWSTSTIEKLKQVIRKTLVENDYLDSTKSEVLNPVLISSILENSIRNNNDERMLAAFNCFG